MLRVAEVASAATLACRVMHSKVQKEVYPCHTCMSFQVDCARQLISTADVSDTCWHNTIAVPSSRLITFGIRVSK